MSNKNFSLYQKKLPNVETRHIYPFFVEYRIYNGEKKSFVQSSGNSDSSKNYSFTEATTISGEVQYRLKQIDFDGRYEYSNVVEVTDEATKILEPIQNYQIRSTPQQQLDIQSQRQKRLGESSQ